MTVRLKVDPDRANLSGVTNLDVAALVRGRGERTVRSRPTAKLDKQIPIAVRLRMEDRAALSDVQNTYVYSMTSNQRVPLSQVSNVDDRDGDPEDQAAQSVPHRDGLGVPDSRRAAVAGARRR